MIRLKAYQDLTLLELTGDVEIEGAPSTKKDSTKENYRFLLWVDDWIHLHPRIRSVTAIDREGIRTPLNFFACSPVGNDG